MKKDSGCINELINIFQALVNCVFIIVYGTFRVSP